MRASGTQYGGYPYPSGFHPSTETIPKKIDVARIIFMMDDTFCVTDEHGDDWYIDEISIEEMARISDTLEMKCRSRGIKNGKDETVSIRCE